ncbi:hypothetical protein JNUCC1_02746 [Lentibacillus sp. JNUCC-1]|nr:hypothetical protein [Lentibacillus sp. JNUCC-1]MUV38875.1 hypothetical protein [Lentibacillus sp. JNUCC-1]
MKGKHIILIVLLITIIGLVIVYFLMEGIIEKYDLERAMNAVVEYKKLT